VKGEVIARGLVYEVAPVVRLVRRFYVSQRKRWAKKREFRKFRDYGRYSFIAWGCAQAVRKRNIRMVYPGGVVEDLEYAS
jgi:hypothetical protein